MGEGEENIVRGPDVVLPVPPCSLGQLMFKQLMTYPPESVLQIDSESGRTLTSAEILKFSIQCADSLKALGIEQGDVAILAGKNGLDISAVATGCLFLGVAACPIDPSMKSFEFQHLFEIIMPKVIFTDMESSKDISDALDTIGQTIPIFVFSADEETSFTKFEDFLVNPTENFQPVGVEDNKESIAFVVCSSGTTGLPKAVKLSDYALLHQLVLSQQMTSNDLLPIPLNIFLQTSHFFWISGVLMFCSTLCGGKVRVIVRNLNAINMLKAMENHKPQMCLLAPAHLNSILQHPDFSNYDVTSVILIITGGSALNKATVQSLREKWKNHVMCTQVYGLSETSGICTLPALGDDIESVGRPSANTEIKFVDLNDGRVLGPLEEGEVHIRIPSMMKGYMQNEEATAETVDEDGWLHTGDLGHHNENGSVFITGRIKEFIKYQNMQIAPAELEKLIFTIPGVIDVGVAGVAVDADTYYPMALVVKDEDSDVTEEDVMKVINENLSDYKHLRGGVVFLDAIPRTSTGKIKRRDLQTLAKILYMDEPLISG